MHEGESMYYLAADPNDVMFSNNLKVCKGVFPSPSFIRAMDDNLKGMVSSYEVLHTDREKEAVFEKVRAEHYPDSPSRMGAIYLFPDYETAVSANREWWNNSRNLYEAKIKDGSSVLTADSQWLNCNPSEYEAFAHKYFQQKRTKNPVIELVVMGVIEVSQEPRVA
jgi:hypothetical protein